MTARNRFPFEFFVVAFGWSWLLWLPLVLAGAGILPLARELVVTLSTPVTIVAIFGPGVGAVYCLRTRNGKAVVRDYLRGVLDFRLGGRRFSFRSRSWAEPRGWRGSCRSSGVRPG